MAANLKGVESVWARFGSMINTGLILVSACAFVYAWGQYDAGIKYDIVRLEAAVIRNAEDVNSYITSHDNALKERFGERRATEAAVSARISTSEKSIEEIVRQVDRTEYRVTVAETALATQNAIQQANADKLNDLIGDVKVIKEVVVRRDTPVRSRKDPQP